MLGVEEVQCWYTIKGSFDAPFTTPSQLVYSPVVGYVTEPSGEPAFMVSQDFPLRQTDRNTFWVTFWASWLSLRRVMARDNTMEE